MDPYEYARQQGQTIGSSPGQSGEPEDVEDLMDLLIQAFASTMPAQGMTAEQKQMLVQFAGFSNHYLATRRVVSTGVVNGDFSLVFEDGQAVPLATSEPKVQRPDPTIPITSPRDSKMKGMPMVDNSVPVTTGQVGSPVRKPG
jgi:hypothetical protein